MNEQIFGEKGEILTVLNDSNFEQSPVAIVQIAPNECLLNSYNMHMKTGDIMVEGIVQALEDGKTFHAFRHCWNKSKVSGKYYDVTKDYVWNTQAHKKKLHRNGHIGDVAYRYFVGYEYKEPNFNETDKEKELAFYFDYTKQIEELKKETD